MTYYRYSTQNSAEHTVSSLKGERGRWGGFSSEAFSQEGRVTYLPMAQMPTETERAHPANHPPCTVGGGIVASFANLSPPPLLHLSKLQGLLSNT